MEVAVNGYFLNVHHTGSGQYAYHLLRALEKRGGDAAADRARALLLPRYDASGGWHPARTRRWRGYWAPATWQNSGGNR